MSTDREKQAGANTAGQSALIEPLGCRSLPMTDNEKIAIWAGLGNWLDYKNKDQDAVLLLPILVAKDCTFKILGAPQNYYMEIADGLLGCCPMITVERQPTIAAAISASVLQLIADKP